MSVPTRPCPHCGKAQVKLFDECPQCHKVYMPSDIVRPIESLLQLLEECPACNIKAFDGWKCHNCGVSISEKAKKAQGSVLMGTKEAEMIKAHFQTK